MSPEYKKIELADIFKKLYIKRYAIIIISISVAILVGIISLFIPNEYESTANLLPAKKQSVNLLSELNLSGLAGGLLNSGNKPSDRFYVLLNSYSIKKRVINKFNLEKVYKTQKSNYPLLNAMKKLDKNTRFEDHDEGNFVINVWDTSPERAKEMADFYVTLLNEFNTQISVKEARDYRLFIQKRYEKANHNLDSLVTANT